MDKLNILSVVLIVVAFSTIVYPAYSQVTLSGLCYDQTVLAVFQLNPILECLDTRIIEVNNSIGGSTDDTVCANVGSGSQVFKDGECNFRTLIGSPDISVTQQTNTITIDFNGTSGSESTVCNNLGTGNPIHKIGTNCSAFSLIAGTGISITNTTDDYTFANTSPDDTTCANVGSGSQIFKDGECNFRTVTNSSRLWKVQNTNDVYLDPTLQSRDSSSTVYQTVTKTNIGTSYVDIYTTLFDMEELVIIDFYNYTYCKANFLWDYVGVGTQQVRWVDQTNNANVLIESTTFTADQTQTSTAFTAVPSWAKSGTGVKIIEWQGKSTTGTDDPIARGYHIICK